MQVRRRNPYEIWSQYYAALPDKDFPKSRLVEVVYSDNTTEWVVRQDDGSWIVIQTDFPDGSCYEDQHIIRYNMDNVVELVDHGPCMDRWPFLAV